MKQLGEDRDSAPLLNLIRKTFWKAGEQAQAAAKAHILYQVC